MEASEASPPATNIGRKTIQSGGWRGSPWKVEVEDRVGQSWEGGESYGGSWEKRKVFRFLRKVGRDEREGDDLRRGEREFQVWGAANEKERRPISDLMRGTWSRF